MVPVQFTELLTDAAAKSRISEADLFVQKVRACE